MNKKNKKAPLLAVVVPCYNEEDVLHDSAEKLKKNIDRLKTEKSISRASYVLFVDDGSRDKTWGIIEALHKTSNIFRGLKLSRNFGHQGALLGGINFVKSRCDCCITIDADLQDDISTFKEMIARFQDGYDVVFGVRRKRKTDSFFKRFTALFFYRFLKFLGVNIIHNHADYRLMSRAAASSLEQFSEVNLFLRGIVTLVGFPSAMVYYDRKERTAGETKYPFSKMLGFAIDGITSFSIVPLRIITVFGVLVFLVSMLMSGFIFYQSLYLDVTIPGWASTVLPSWILNGILIICVGIIGEYTGKIYMEVKRRPRFIVEKNL